MTIKIGSYVKTNFHQLSDTTASGAEPDKQDDRFTGIIFRRESRQANAGKYHRDPQINQNPVR